MPFLIISNSSFRSWLTAYSLFILVIGTQAILSLKLSPTTEGPGNLTRWFRVHRNWIALTVHLRLGGYHAQLSYRSIANEHNSVRNYRAISTKSLRAWALGSPRRIRFIEPNTYSPW